MCKSCKNCANRTTYRNRYARDADMCSLDGMDINDSKNTCCNFWKSEDQDFAMEEEFEELHTAILDTASKLDSLRKEYMKMKKRNSMPPRDKKGRFIKKK